MNRSQSSEFFTPLLIFLLAFIPRILYIHLTKSYSIPFQSGELEMAAINLIKHESFGGIYRVYTPHTAHVAPFYPWFLSLIYMTMGEVTWKGKYVQEILSALMTSMSFMLMPILAARLGFSKWVGIISGIILALSPLYLWVETSGAWEQPYVVLFSVLGLLSILTLGKNPTAFDRIYSGIVIGIGGLISPSLFTTLFLALSFLFLQHRSARAPAFRAFILSFLILSPWLVRNYARFGEFVFIRSNMGLELQLGNRDGANGISFEIDSGDASERTVRGHPFLDKAEAQKLADVGEIPYMKEKKEEAVSWILGHPKEFFLLTIRRFQLFFFPSPELWPGTAKGKILKAVVLSFLSFGMFASLILFWKNRFAYRWEIFAMLIGPSWIYLVTHVDPRYRYPIVPFQMLLTVWVLTQVLSRWVSGKRSQRFEPT